MLGVFILLKKIFFYTKNGMLFSIQNKKEKTIAPIVNSCWGSKYEENSIVVFGDFGSKVYNYKGELEYDTDLYVEYYENQNNYIIKNTKNPLYKGIYEHYLYQKINPKIITFFDKKDYEIYTTFSLYIYTKSLNYFTQAKCQYFFTFYFYQNYKNPKRIS